jgi:hypothetical protein
MEGTAVKKWHKRKNTAAEGYESRYFVMLNWLISSKSVTGTRCIEGFSLNGCCVGYLVGVVVVVVVIDSLFDVLKICSIGITRR